MLNRSALLSLIVLLALCASPCIAQSKKKQSKSRSRSPRPVTEFIVEMDEHFPDMWKQFTSPEGKFHILFPGAPTEKTQEENLREGKITGRQFQLVSKIALYQVNFVDYPVKVDTQEKIKPVLDSMRADALERLKGQVLSESDMIIEGHPGRYVVWRTDTGMLMKARYMLSGNRIYALLFGTPEESNLPDEDKRFRESIAIKFFDSFKLSS